MKISAKLLREKGACESGIKQFIKVFGRKEIEVTLDVFEKAEKAGLDLQWAANLLSDRERTALDVLDNSASRAYCRAYETDKATKPLSRATKQYHQCWHRAWKQYEKATKGARTARDQAYRAADEAYREATKKPAERRAKQEAASTARLAKVRAPLLAARNKRLAPLREKRDNARRDAMLMVLGLK